MSIYRAHYENWFNNLNEEERKAETARMNTSKGKGKASVAAAKKMTTVDANAILATTLPAQQPQTINFNLNQPQVMAAQPMMIQQPQTIAVQPAQAMPQQMMQPQMMQPQPQQTPKDLEKMQENILRREPVEPARSAKQLFINDWLPNHRKKSLSDAKAAWKKLDRKEKQAWENQLEPQRQKYIDEYTVFVRGLNKEELELYTALKNKRDKEEEMRKQNESSDSEDSSAESESESESESDSDSD